MPNVKRKTQYKRNPKLKRAREKQMQDEHEWSKRFSAWEEVLKNPSDLALNRIADLLARLGFEPDEHGIPGGEWPTITKISPLVILDSFKASVGKRPSGEASEQTTLRWKADVLEVATLVWAGAIEPNIEEIQKMWPRVLPGDVFRLSESSDLEKFWKRPGVGKTAADIRGEWERGEFSIDPSQLADWLRKAKGGT